MQPGRAGARNSGGRNTLLFGSAAEKFHPEEVRPPPAPLLRTPPVLRGGLPIHPEKLYIIGESLVIT